ncbi:hypothetical protein AAES_14685 [Amazona aestiva]|uniref:Uncharacterized protein n=1 Tax=Amazona aestiva TaxID=12930 RepID=A0A0Q3U6R6_AMAAE|nr:hypothetical protein AAES_14685 [Amazona aestiva]
MIEFQSQEGRLAQAWKSPLLHKALGGLRSVHTSADTDPPSGRTGCNCWDRVTVGKSGLLQLRPEHESVPDISEMMQGKTLVLFPSLLFAQICLPLAKARGRGYMSIMPASAGT